MPSPTSLAWLAVLTAAVACVIGQRISTLAGPFRIIPEHFEKCPPMMRPAKTYYKHSYSGWRDRHNPDLWYYSWNGTSFFTMSDNLTVEINVASWSARGGWIDNAYIFTLPRICTVFRASTPNLWRKVMKAIFDDTEAFCPFPPGDYSFANLSTDFNMKVPPSFFYGKWRATATMRRTASRETIGCARAFGSTVPKLSKQQQQQPGKQGRGSRPTPSAPAGPTHIESQD